MLPWNKDDLYKALGTTTITVADGTDLRKEMLIIDGLHHKLYKIVSIDRTNNTYTIRPFFWYDRLSQTIHTWWMTLRWKLEEFYYTYIDKEK